ncbi:hypothetical protein Tco_0188584 [Tanacetum coccineum]
MSKQSKGNQNRYQGNNFNTNQNRGGNFNQNRQGAVYQTPPYQPPATQTLIYQAPTSQIQGVSKTDFENYDKANDAVLKNVQNQGRPFLRTAKALIDLYEETLTLRVGKEELVYYADKSEKNKDKNFVHAISIIDFSKDDPFSGLNHLITLPPSSSPVKTSDNFKKFADELTPLDSLPPGNDDLTLKKDLHEETFQIYSNPLFEFDDDFNPAT